VVGEVIFSRAIMYAGLTVLKWLFGFTGLLLAALTVVQAMRGDLDARPLMTTITGLGFVGVAVVCHLVATRMMKGNG
jgi:phosphate/sulfate permease